MMFHHDFGSFFIGVVFVITALAVVFDMRHYSDTVWKRADEPKNLWFVVGSVAAWPIGLLVYLFVVRPKLEKIHTEDSHELLKERMFREWSAEQERRTHNNAQVNSEEKHQFEQEVEPTTVINAGEEKTV